VGVIPVKKTARVLVAVAIAIHLGGLFALFTPVESHAVTTVPTKVNFQGRLTDSSGNIVADGSYNVKFLLYTASSGGSDVWNETRENNGTDTRVVVTNGLFSVRLGDATPIPASLFASGSLYLEVVMATPATATCSTASCASWESAMTPRSLLATSAYAFNSETLDGKDSADFSQLTASNLYTNDNLFKTTSATAFRVQDGGGTELLLADTSNTVVKIGNPGSSTLSNVRLVTSNAEFTTTVRIGNTTNGVEFSATAEPLYRGSARPTRTITLVPEYPGATFTGDGSNNNGSLSSDFCSEGGWLNVNASVCGGTGTSEEHNYYAWTTTQGTAQDYDIYVVYRLPSDYDTGSMSSLMFVGQGTNSSQVASLSLYSSGSSVCSTTGDIITSGSDWENNSPISTPFSGCTSPGANQQVIFKIHLEATQNQTVRAGEITFTYRSKF
jgi:hypothetical protein